MQNASIPPIPSHDLSGNRHAQLTARLARHDLRNRVSDNNARLLDLLLRQPRCDADLQCRLELPPLLLHRARRRHGHRLQARDEDAVGEALHRVSRSAS